MPEILMISGKGGTGKTSITAAFASLEKRAVICDLDVDTPDLHLILQPDTAATHDFTAGYEAAIEQDHCDGCGICLQMCRYDAIQTNGTRLVVDTIKCEGCKVCVEFCPNHAIAFTPKMSGCWYESDTRFGPMIHAQLFPGEENSGRLVALLRKMAKSKADTQRLELIISDGPPGIGCPVISAVSGVDLAVIVTESTPSGRHDLERVVDLCEHFKVPGRVILNKCDLNSDIAEEIDMFCHQRGFDVVAKLPHDPVFVHAMVQNQSVTEYMESNMARLIRSAWEKVREAVLKNDKLLLAAKQSISEIKVQTDIY